MAAVGTTHCVIRATLSQAIDVAGGVLMADVFFAVPWADWLEKSRAAWLEAEIS
jgi:hypothetical protein